MFMPNEREKPTLFRPKSQDELKGQLEIANRVVGSSLFPPTLGETLLDLPQSELVTRFPLRYKTYLSALRYHHGAVDESLIGDRKIITALNNLDAYLKSHTENSKDQTLKPNQVKVLEALRDFLEQGSTQGYFKLPTAFGKTVIFTEFVEATSLRTLIAVPTKLLVDQTADKFKQFAEGVGVGRVYSDRKEYGRQVHVTTYDSLIADLAKGNITPEDFDLLILDEAHRSLSDKRANAVQSFKNAVKIGFTATPYRSDEKNVGHILDHEIYKVGIKEAVQGNLLSPLSCLVVKTTADLSNVTVSSTGEFRDDELERAVNITSRNAAAVNLYSQMFYGKSAVTYCVDIKHAQKVAETYQELGINVAVVHGKQSREQQAEILRKFRTGEISVVCNADLLIEGFDQPRASVCINLRPTLSPIIAEQRGGRVLRLDPEDSNKHAYIVDFMDRDVWTDKKPIYFAEVIGQAEIPTKEELERRGEGLGINIKPEIKIEGIEVFTEPTEVMRVIGEAIYNNKDITEKEKDRFTAVEAFEKYGLPVSVFKRYIRDYKDGFRYHHTVYVGENLEPETVRNSVTGRRETVYPIEAIRAFLQAEIAKKISRIRPEWDTGRIYDFMSSIEESEFFGDAKAFMRIANDPNLKGADKYQREYSYTTSNIYRSYEERTVIARTRRTHLRSKLKYWR